MKEKRIDLPLTKNANLALWKVYSDSSSKGKDVFLTHGTFSNRKICMGITEYLVKRGYNCWILEWRNHGESSITKSDYDFEDVAKEDIDIALRYLFEEEQLRKIDCVTHSGGGLCLTLNLLEHPEYTERINRMVFFGCQAWGAADNLFRRLRMIVVNFFGKSLGYLPGKILKRPHNEDYSILKHWFRWNLSKEFKNEEGRDYQSEMPQIKIPILAICGTGDTMIAPAQGCQDYLASFKNPNNKVLVCGINTGYMEDYNHGRIIYSRSAEKEIYGEVLNWIK